MTEDWSLEGKGISFAGGETLTVHKEAVLYPSDVIEILRQKLIEDIENFEGSQHLPKWSKDEIIEAINKRFEID